MKADDNFTERLREIAYRDNAKTVSVASADLRAHLEATQRYVLTRLAASTGEAALSAAPLPLGGEPVATVEPLTEFSYFECPECGAVATPTNEDPMVEGVEALREALTPLVHLSTREAKSVLDKFNAALSLRPAIKSDTPDYEKEWREVWDWLLDRGLVDPHDDEWPGFVAVIEEHEREIAAGAARVAIKSDAVGALEEAMDAAYAFVKQNLADIKTEKGLVGVWCGAFRAGWDASARAALSRSQP